MPIIDKIGGVAMFILLVVEVPAFIGYGINGIAECVGYPYLAVGWVFALLYLSCLVVISVKVDGWW